MFTIFNSTDRNIHFSTTTFKSLERDWVCLFPNFTIKLYHSGTFSLRKSQRRFRTVQATNQNFYQQEKKLVNHELEVNRVSQKCTHLLGTARRSSVLHVSIERTIAQVGTVLCSQCFIFFFLLYLEKSYTIVFKHIVTTEIDKPNFRKNDSDSSRDESKNWERTDNTLKVYQKCNLHMRKTAFQILQISRDNVFIFASATPHVVVEAIYASQR